ncbi:MAG: hypothetical protein ACRDGU_04945 [Actinomycetota bacterium]
MKTSSILYWALVAVMVSFGFLGLASIGAPFLLIGLALAFLWPARGKPTVFWPVVIGVGSFIVGYILAAPLACTGEEEDSSSGASGSTQCFNLLGIDYSGTGDYNPPLWPGLVVGLATGVVGSLLTVVVTRRVQRETAARRAR